MTTFLVEVACRGVMHLYDSITVIARILDHFSLGYVYFHLLICFCQFVDHQFVCQKAPRLMDQHIELHLRPNYKNECLDSGILLMESTYIGSTYCFFHHK